MTTEEFITHAWTYLSATAVLLALGAIGYSWAEKRDATRDFRYQLQGMKDEIMLHLALHEYHDARRIFLAHILVFAHQAIFLFVGIYAQMTPNLDEPKELPTVQDEIIPIGLLSAQMIIVLMQVILFYVSKSQRRSRKRLNVLYDKQAMDESGQLNTRPKDAHANG